MTPELSVSLPSRVTHHSWPADPLLIYAARSVPEHVYTSPSKYLAINCFIMILFNRTSKYPFQISVQSSDSLKKTRIISIFIIQAGEKV